MSKLFDKYDIRARLSPSIILISPILLNMYLLIHSVREISTTIVVSIASICIVNLLTIISRYNSEGKVNKILKKDEVLAYELLSPLNNVIDKEVKQTYYKFLNKNINGLDLSFELTDITIIKTKCYRAVRWLKERASDKEKFPIVKEESINTGFCKNMYGYKFYGIILNVVLIIGIVTYYYLRFGITFINLPTEAMLSVIIDIMYFIIWKFIINDSLVNLIYKKYSLALFNTCKVID